MGGGVRLVGISMPNKSRQYTGSSVVTLPVMMNT